MNKSKVTDKLAFIEASLKGDNGDIVVKECGALLEQAFKKIFKELMLSSSFEQRKELQAAEELIGQGKQGIDHFGLGKLSGLAQKTSMIKKWGEMSGANVNLLASVDFQSVARLRNKCTHSAAGCSQFEAELVFNYLKTLLMSMGLVEVSKEPASSTGNAGSFGGDEKQSLETVYDAYPEIKKYIVGCVERGEPIEIMNFGLDLETVWPQLIVPIVGNKDWKDIHYRGLIIDSSSEEIVQHCSLYISPAIAKDSLQKISKLKETQRESFEERNIRIDVRSYSVLPVIHGFCLNKEFVIMSLTSFDQQELTGGFGHYSSHDKNSPCELHAYYVKSFIDWFEYHWALGGDA